MCDICLADQSHLETQPQKPFPLQISDFVPRQYCDRVTGRGMCACAHNCAAVSHPQEVKVIDLKLRLDSIRR